MEHDSTQELTGTGRLVADRYRLEYLLGRGGTAAVYRAYDERLARPVALKLLRGRYSKDPALRARFEEEAKAAAMVSHPNVIAVFDAGKDGDEAFIVMELVAGETLAQRIGHGPLDAMTACRIGAEILDALAAAHARRVLHRDIKPANILITEEGRAKVADFGIAKAIHPSRDEGEPTTMNVVLGTPSYLAPERARGMAATVASDLWSVGVVLYEALSGSKPFEGDTAIAVTVAAQEGRHIPLLQRCRGADPLLAAVVERALEPEPSNRFLSAAEMARALRVSTGGGTAPLAAAPGVSIGFIGPLPPRGSVKVAPASAARPVGRSQGVTTPARLLPEDRKAPPAPVKSRGRARSRRVGLGGLAAAAGLLALVFALLSVGPGGHRALPVDHGRHTKRQTARSTDPRNVAVSRSSSTTPATSTTVASGPPSSASAGQRGDQGHGDGQPAHGQHSHRDHGRGPDAKGPNGPKAKGGSSGSSVLAAVPTAAAPGTYGPDPAPTGGPVAGADPGNRPPPAGDPGYHPLA